MGLNQLLIFAVAMAAMYFLLIRPQQQRQKQQRQMVASLKAGQRIVTIGGLVGEIVEVREGRLLLRVADGSEMEYVRESVGRILRDDELVDEVGDEDDDLVVDETSDADEEEAAPPAPPLPPTVLDDMNQVDEGEGVQ